MNSSNQVLLGLIHHEDEVRTRSQMTQAKLVAEGLQRAGLTPILVEEFRQELRDPRALPIIVVRLNVLRRQWRQEIHHLREIRRRKGVKLSIPFRKRRQALERVMSIVRHRRSALQAFERLEIEAALSLKHLRMWQKVVDSDIPGAVIVEDDFYLRGDSSPTEVGALVAGQFDRHDLVDLAGGLTRESLGLPEAKGQDLSLPFIVANTTCAYFISKRACARLVGMVESEPRLLYLGPDFLVTELNAKGFAGSTLLPYDLPLIHGSRDGTVESSIPY